MPVCKTHYTRIMKWGDPRQERARPLERDLPCSVEGCERQRAARGFCANHYQIWRKRGSTELKNRRWTEREDALLRAAARYPSGHLVHGEIPRLMGVLGRTRAAVATRLSDLHQAENV